MEQDDEGSDSSDIIWTRDCDGKNGRPDLDEACTYYDDPAEDSEDEHFDPADYVGEYGGFPLSDEEEDFLLGTARSTDDTSKEPVPEDDTHIISKRRHQKRVSKPRALAWAKLALRADRLAARTWKPKRVLPIYLIVGMSLNARWKCEQLIRAHTAHLAVQKGVNIHQTTIKVQMSCRNKSCKAVILFNWQPKSGHWKLNKHQKHNNERLAKSCQFLDLMYPRGEEELGTIAHPLIRHSKWQGRFWRKRLIFQI